MLQPSDNYVAWLTGLKSCIQSAQIKAALRVNTELLLLHWDLGREILQKEKSAEWGDKLVPQLSKDLLKAFLEMKGFSPTNLGYIKRWRQFYSQAGDHSISPQVVVRLNHNSKSSENQETAMVPQTVGQLAGGDRKGVKCYPAAIRQQAVAGFELKK